MNSASIEKSFQIKVLFLVAFLVVFTATANAQTYDLAIKNVNLFDSKNKRVLKNRTILIKAEKIARIVDSNSRLKATKTIEGRGRLIVPGFVDTHTHFLQASGIQKRVTPKELDSQTINDYRQLIADQYLPYGVTTIVDMAMPEAWMSSAIEIQKSPRPSFPNLYISGSSIISDQSWDRNPPAHHKKVFSPKEAREKVRQYAATGVKHIKLYWKLNLPEMEAAVDEANKLGITYNAHVDSDIVDIREAMRLGVKNFEHFFTIIPDTVDFRESLPMLQKKYGVRRTSGIDEFSARLVLLFQIIRDNPKLDKEINDSFRRMGQEGVTMSTALTQLATSAGYVDKFFSFDFVPPRNMPKMPSFGRRQKEITNAFPLVLEYLKKAHDSGVKIRIGTDTRYGGEAFIRELELLQKHGFTPEEVLQIATINGAEAMKISDKFGSIEEGKQADMVIFEKDPMKDVANYRGAKTVIKQGQEIRPPKALGFAFKRQVDQKGFDFGSNWIKQFEGSALFRPTNPVELNEVAFRIFAAGRPDEAIATYKLRDKTFKDAKPAKNDLDENQLNILGYDYLGQGKNSKALSVLKYTAEKYPKSSNAQDSLGEAYLAIGNEKLALESYRKASELDPKNATAKYVINKLEGKPFKVNFETMKRYAGDYIVNDNVSITIKIVDGKLKFQATNQPVYDLEAISNEQFVIPNSTTNVVFVSNTDGSVEAMLLNQGSSQSRHKRKNE